MVGWFEIPVSDMKRAKSFYDSVFEISIELNNFGGLTMGWFPNDDQKKGANGSLVQHEAYVPSSTDGALVYFSCKDVLTELARVEVAGGVIIQTKTQIGQHGYMALIHDSEGNRIALHSNS